MPPPDATETQVALARMDENVKALLTTTAEIKQMVEKVSSDSATAQVVAAEANRNAEEAKRNAATAFTRIDEARNERQELVQFAAQLKGAGKAATIVFGLLQTLVMALVLWLFSSVSSLRETKAVLEYRLQTVEQSQKAERR